MDRRTALKSGGAAAIGLALGGCAARPAAPAVPARTPRPMVRLPRVHAAFDRVIRSTVGLRPHRPAGFVLRAERRGDTLLVHNYGHGGAGWSLSWGTAAMAVEDVRSAGHQRVAVLGAGVVGLTTALEAQRQGLDVTIYAASLPPDTTSNMALAGWTPTSGLINLAERTPEWDAQFGRAVTIAYRRWQLLAGAHWGVSWVPNYAPTDNAASASGSNPLLPAELVAPRELLEPGEHPFPTTYAVRRMEMRFEPSIFLDAALRDFRLAGGRIIIRRFTSLDEAGALAPAVVNCTGLGSRELAGDTALTPLRGQLIVLVPQPEVQYATSGGLRIDRTTPGGFLHMMPRTDGIVLGGTSEEGEWSTEPSDAETRRIVERHVELFESMRG
jgi:D-amino-acid oxidase